MIPFLFLFVASSYANIGIRDPGCYVVQGNLKVLQSKKMELVVNSGSRSELHLNVSASSALQKLKPGLIETVVYFKKGPVQDKTAIILSEKQTKSIKAKDMTSAKQWIWQSEGKNQKCI